MNKAVYQEVQPEWLRYPEAQRYSGLGHSTLWKLVSGGEIKAAKVGKAVRISRSSLDKYLELHSLASAEK